MKKIKLSIVILNYNTAELLTDCLNSIHKLKKELGFEVIVVDNGSSDDSVEVVKSRFKWVRLVQSKENLGFSAGNNLARDVVAGKYVLFLNSDTVVYKYTLKKSVEFMEEDNSVGALGVKTLLANGELDKDSRRSFPTPWVSFTHFARLDRMFPKSGIFSKYWYGYMPVDKTAEVESLQGAFLLSPKNILDKVGWFDEDYFLDGEDIDLCWKIHKLGKKVIYYPEVHILHLKGATKGKNRKTGKMLNKNQRIKYVTAGVNSMEIFYRKNLMRQYPFYINFAVLFGIKLMKIGRIVKLYLS